MSYMTIAMAITAVAAGASAYGQYQQGQASQKIANNNAIVAEYQAQDAQQRGELEAQAARRQAQALEGAQRATMASRGLDISEGTPADILDQTNFFGQEDARISRMNAAKEAWALRARKAGFQGEATAARSAGNWGATSSLLGGAASVSGQWANYNKPARN